MTIGLLRGSVIFVKICHLVHPSRRAASSTANGTVSKNPFAIWKLKPAPPEVHKDQRQFDQISLCKADSLEDENTPRSLT